MPLDVRHMIVLGRYLELIGPVDPCERVLPAPVIRPEVLPRLDLPVGVGQPEVDGPESPENLGPVECQAVRRPLVRRDFALESDVLPHMLPPHLLVLRRGR